VLPAADGFEDLDHLQLNRPIFREEIAMANELGKRYICPNCGSNVLCTKGGEGEIQCCDTEMELQQPRKLPSSD